MKNISVVIEWSENGRIDNLKKPLSFKKANEILSKQHENNIQANMVGYEKTKFKLVVESNGNESVYKGRFDLGCKGEWDLGVRDLYTYIKSDLDFIEKNEFCNKETINFWKKEVLPICKGMI